jgi:hypothetical protein
MCECFSGVGFDDILKCWIGSWFLRKAVSSHWACVGSFLEQDGVFASISMRAQQVSASESLTCEAAAKYDMDEAPIVDVPGLETRDSALEERMTTVEITAGTTSARFGILRQLLLRIRLLFTATLLDKGESTCRVQV